MIAGRSEVIANARCGFGLIREGSAQLSWRQLRFTSPCSWRPRCVERRATNGRTRERKQQYLRGSCSPCFWVSPAPAFTSGAPRLGGSTQRATRRTTCLPISPFQKMGRPLLVVLSVHVPPSVVVSHAVAHCITARRQVNRHRRASTHTRHTRLLPSPPRPHPKKVSGATTAEGDSAHAATRKAH